MIGTFLVYAALSGMALSLGWISWSTPAFMFVAFAPLWFIMYKTDEQKYKHPYLMVAGMSILCFAVWNAMTTIWLKNATWGGFFIAFGFNVAAMTIIMTLSYFVARRKGYALGTIFWTVLWMSFEKMHLEWELAWPWLTLGNGFANYPWMVQWYEYTGALGGSLWVLVSNALVFYVWRAYDMGARDRKLYKLCAIPAAWIAVPLLISVAVETQIPATQYRMEAVALQPNIDPYEEKYSMDDDSAARLMMEMADSVILPSTRLVVAPETFLPDYKDMNHPYDNPVYDTLRLYCKTHDDLAMVTGTSYIKRYPMGDRPTPTAHKGYAGTWHDLYNVAVQFTQDDIRMYQKSKLVPGVESFPYRSIAEPLLGDAVMDFGGMVGSIVTQDKRSVFSSHGDSLRLAPVICYESVFGEFVTGYVKEGANAICIITNDAWWGNTEGHRQHLAYARLRAVETRLPVIRSANTGISAFINPAGKITTALPYDIKKALVGYLDINNAPQTFYVRHGDYISRPMPYLAVLLFLFSLLPARKRK